MGRRLVKHQDGSYAVVENGRIVGNKSGAGRAAPTVSGVSGFAVPVAETAAAAVHDQLYEAYLAKMREKYEDELRTGFHEWLGPQATEGPAPEDLWDEACKYALTDEGKKRVDELLTTPGTPVGVQRALTSLREQAQVLEESFARELQADDFSLRSQAIDASGAALAGALSEEGADREIVELIDAARETEAARALAEAMRLPVVVAPTARVDAESSVWEGAQILGHAQVSSSRPPESVPHYQKLARWSRIRGASVVEDYAVVKDSYVRDGSRIGRHASITAGSVERSEVSGSAKVRSSDLAGSRVGEQAVLEACSVKSSEVSGSAKITGGKVTGSRVSGQALLESCSVENSEVSGEAAILRGAKVKGSRLDGRAFIEEGRTLVENSEIVDSSAIFDSEVKDSLVSGQAVLVNCHVSAARVSGSTQVVGSTVSGVQIDRGALVNAAVSGPEDVQTGMAADGTVWTRYVVETPETGGMMRKMGFRGWRYTAQHYDAAANRWDYVVFDPKARRRGARPGACGEDVVFENPPAHQPGEG